MAEIAVETTTVLANLLDAFNGESNAHARYLSFSARADAEGWHGIASLFCAAAYAEHIHAGNHARVIKQQCGTPHAEIHRAESRSTLENLRVALGGEQFEIETTYPEFIEAAEAAQNTAAVRTFNWALEAEKTHSRLFTEAISLLKSGKKDSWAATERIYYVCPGCGYTSESANEHQRCPVCKMSWDKFEDIR
ncbi:MAG TPA: rubrerythrin family protein [Terracidiphilus sp.]|jgi:rubrerythrin